MGTLSIDQVSVEGTKTVSYCSDVTVGMGSPPCHPGQLQQILQQQPERITWSEPRETTVCKNSSGKLGIKVHTYQGTNETYSVITKVTSECQVVSGTLNVCDRVIRINNLDVTHTTGKDVLSQLTSSNNIVLIVARPWKVQVRHGYQSIDPSIKSFASFDSGSTISSGVKLSPRSLDKSDCVNVAGNISQTFLSCGISDTVQERQQTATRENNVCGKIEQSGVAETLLVEEICNRNDCSVEEIKLDNTETGIKIKRGISQVSGSSSNQSVGSNQSNSSMRRRERMGKSKKEKDTKRFPKTMISDHSESDELEPLRPTETLSPPSLMKMNSKYSNFTVDSGTHSLPLKDSAVSMQDIVFCEDQAQSLPIGNPGGSVTASHISGCTCPQCVQMECRVCHNCGTRPAPATRKPAAYKVSLFTETLQLPDDYSNFLLKKPHLAVWDGKNTHVVEIDKGKDTEFGFSYKVKLGKNQDASLEIYTLVKDVEKTGPAKGKLYVGDWIRSVNGTPIQIPTDAFSLINNCAKGRSLRLLVQRPVGFSQQALSLRKDKADKAVADLNPPSPQPQSLSPSIREQDPLIPGTIEPKKEPEKEPVPQHIYFHDTTNPPFPRTVKLPKVKLFICGSEAEKCTNIILRDSEMDLRFRHPGYASMNFSMSTDCFGNVVVSSTCSSLFSTSSQSSVSSTQTDCKSGADVRCKHCGGDFISTGSPNALGTVVNVELFVVPDDRFFHNCCNYLFTKSSIFILTFDGSKLLRSAPAEFSRLQNLSHTIRSFAGDDCPVMLCGLLDGRDMNARSLADEVNALFYTPFNTQLQNFNVSKPELINVQASLSSADGNRNQQLRVSVWKMVTETIQRQRVLHPCLLIIDHLNSLRSKELFITEEQLMDIIKQKLPAYQLDVHQMILTYLIMNGEIIYGSLLKLAHPQVTDNFPRMREAAPFYISSLQKIESLVIVSPRSLLELLHNVISRISEDKPTWNRTHLTGYLRAECLQDLSDRPEIGSRFTSFLESCGLIFNRPMSTGQEYFLPYFCQVPGSLECPLAERKEQELLLQFNEHGSSQTFFQLLFYLASQSDTPASFIVQAVNCCMFQHKGITCTAYHQKIDDRIRFIFKWEDKTSSLKPPDMFSWLYSTSHKALDYIDVHFLLGAPCPLRETCSRQGSPGSHIIDIRDAKQQTCGDCRVDMLPQIRMWRHRDAEVPAGSMEMLMPASVTGPGVSSLAGPGVSSVTGPGVYSVTGPGVSSATGLAVSILRQPSKCPVYVMDLNYTVLHAVCMKLRIHNDLGSDWRGLAGLMGYSMEMVQMYETVKDPAEQLVVEWSKTNNATISSFLELLTELGRKDIIKEIQQALAAFSTQRNPGQRDSGSSGHSTRSSNDDGNENVTVDCVEELIHDDDAEIIYSRNGRGEGSARSGAGNSRNGRGEGNSHRVGTGGQHNQNNIEVSRIYEQNVTLNNLDVVDQLDSSIGMPMQRNITPVEIVHRNITES